MGNGINSINKAILPVMICVLLSHVAVTNTESDIDMLIENSETEEISFNFELKLNATRIGVILRIISESCVNKLELKNGLQYIAQKLDEYGNKQRMCLTKLILLNDSIKEIKKLINWKVIQKRVNIPSNNPVYDEFSSQLGEWNIVDNMRSLQQFVDLLITFDDNPLQKYYTSEPIKDFIQVIKELQGEIISNAYYNTHRGIKTKIIESLLNQFLQKGQFTYLEFQINCFLDDIKKSNVSVYNYIMHQERQTYEETSINLEIMPISSEENANNQIMHCAKNLTIIILFILRMPIIQLREEKMREFLTCSFMQKLADSKNFTNLIFNEDSMQTNNIFVPSNYHTMNLMKRILMPFKEKILKFLEPESEEPESEEIDDDDIFEDIDDMEEDINDYENEAEVEVEIEVEGNKEIYIVKCIKQLLLDIVQENSEDIGEIDFKTVYDEILDIDLHIKNKIDTFMNNQRFENINPKVSVQELRSEVEAFKKVIYKEIHQCLLYPKSDIDILMKQISTLNKFQQEHTNFIDKLNMKIQLQCEIEKNMLNYPYKLMKNKEAKSLEFDEYTIDLLLAMCCSSLESEFDKFEGFRHIKTPLKCLSEQCLLDDEYLNDSDEVSM